jgi:hypothetical protein
VEQEKAQFMLGEDKRIQIIGVARSGTTYMYDILKFYHLGINYMTREGDENFGYLKDVTETQTEIEYRFVKQLEYLYTQPKYVLKSHIWHLDLLKHFNLLERYKNLFDYNIAVISTDLFNLALSLSISTVKQQWAKYPDNEKITVPTDLFLLHLSGQLHNQTNLINNVYDMDIHEVIIKEKINFWPRSMISNMKLSGNTSIDNFKKFKTTVPAAPDKKDIVENYNELWDIGLRHLDDLINQDKQGDNILLLNQEINGYNLQNIKMKIVL